MKRLLLASFLLLFSTTAAAQTIISNKFQFLTGPCTLSSGSGSPEGVVTGKVCDTYWRTDTGQIYTKVSGTGNTGWAAGGVSGSGTTNTVAKWQSASVLTDASITDTGSVVTILPTGNVVFNNGGNITFNPTGNNLLPNTGYDINIGSLTNKFLSLHAAELWVETLVAQDTLATIGGRVLVAPTTLLTSDLASGATSISVKHNNLANGDRIYMEANALVEFMAVTSGPSGVGPYTYTVTRNLDGSGANNWSAGDAILNTGQTGDGFVDIYSVRGIRAGTEQGPTIVGNVRNSSTYNDWSTRWALGNLNGIHGYATDIYGVALGGPTPGGHTGFVLIEPANGIRLLDGAGNTRVSLTPAGTATFSGDGNGVTNINGGNIQTGTVAANKITAGNGRNMIRNSECRTSTADWAEGTNTGLGTSFTFGLASWRLHDELNTCYIRVPTGTAANGTVTYAFSNVYLPITPSTKYEASVYVGIHRMTRAEIFIEWTDSSSAFISYSSAGNACTSAVGGTTLNAFCRTSILATSPSNAHFARILIQGVHNGVDTDTYMFFVRAFFSEAKAQQTEFSEWSPAGITEIIGGIVKTDTLTATEIAANAITTSELNADSVTSAKIAANTIVAADIAADTITASEIAANAITTSELNADSVTSAKIVTGTIEASDIATGTITADRMNVSSLSAISANVGTLTSGTIDGVTVNAGSGDEVVLNSSGISISSGTGAGNQIKWGNSQTIHGQGDGDLWLKANSGILQLFSGASAPGVNVSGGMSVSTGLELVTGSLKLTPLTGGTSFLCLDGSDIVYASASTCDGSAPTAAARIEVLEREVAELRALVQQLLQRNHQ